MIGNHDQHLFIHKKALEESTELVLDYRKYNGRGRPKKSDYTAFNNMHKYYQLVVEDQVKKHMDYQDKLLMEDFG